MMHQSQCITASSPVNSFIRLESRLCKRFFCTQPETLFTSTFRRPNRCLHQERMTRCQSLFTARWRCGEQIVPDVTESVAPLVTVHDRGRSSDPYRLFNPACPPVLLSVYHSRSLPVYHTIVSVDVVSYGRLVLYFLCFFPFSSCEPLLCDVLCFLLMFCQARQPT